MPRIRKYIRRQRVDLGGLIAVRYGASWGAGDIYYELMELTWPAFIAAAASFFRLVNLGFGALYASLPGAISNAAPGSLADGFFFSVETLATVGYGEMAPATHLGHVIAVVEIITGIFLTATITGLIFARFARPRDSLVFSNRVVVTMIGDRRVAMLRLAGMRSRPIAGATAQFQVLETVVLPNGKQYRRFVDLPLLNQRNAMMAIAWTLAHVIDDASPLKPILDDPDAMLRLLVTVSGLDTLLSNQTFGARMYTRDDVHHDHDFVDMLDNRDNGTIHIDLTRLHDTYSTLAEATPAA
ncbi:MAG: ion channel [Janthinobacterium lividum]